MHTRTRTQSHCLVRPSSSLNVSSCVRLPCWSPDCTPAQDNVSSEGHAESTMQFLDSLGTLEFDFADLAGSGVLYKDVVTAMKAHSGG